MKPKPSSARFLLCAGSLAVFLIASAAQAQLLTGIDSLAYVYHAQMDPDGTGDGKWTASESYHSYPESDLTLNGSPTYNASTGSASANLSGAFSFTSAAYATQADSALNTYGLMSREGSTNNDSMTWELWFRPAAGSTNASIDGQYLFATQSNNLSRGAYLKFKHNVAGATVDIQLLVRRDRGMSTASWTLDATDANANGLIDILEDDFVQVIAMYDRDDAVRGPEDYAYLAVNAGAPTTDANITDQTAIRWNGQTHFGRSSNAPRPCLLEWPGDQDGPSTTATDTGFAGDIALIRIYDTALTDEQVTAAYESVVGAAPPSTFQLTIAQNAPNLDFTWESKAGMSYRLKSSADLSTDFPLWNLVVEDLPNTAPAGSTSILKPGDSLLFYRMEEYPSPPVTLLDEDFESGDGGFTAVNHTTGTIWAPGDPASTGEGGTVDTGNGGSTNCWGTDIGNPGFYATGTDTSLISPVIDLTGVAGATLSFAQAIDILAPGDTLVVNIIDDTTDTVIEAAIHTSTPDTDVNTADWETVDSIAISGGEPVRIEWRFTGTNDGTYIGAYIDDVVVTVPAS